MTNSLTRRAKATPRTQLRNQRLFWEPSASLRRLGFTNAALGPLTSENLNQADQLNEQADAALGTSSGKARPVTFKDARDRFLSDPAVTSLAGRTQRDYKTHLKNVGESLDCTTLPALTPRAIRKWYDDRRVIAPRGAFNEAITLRTFLTWCMAEELISSNPASLLKLARPDGRKRVGTREELWAMVHAAEALGRPSVAAAAILMATSMQRPADVMAMQREDIDDGVVRIRQNKTKTYVAFTLHPAFSERLGDLSGTGPLIVSETTRKPYGERAFERAWSKVREAAAKDMPSLLGDDPSVKDEIYMGKLDASHLRRTGMVWAAQGGATIPQIVSVSGHTIKHGTDILETYIPRERLLAEQAVSRLNLVSVD